MHAIGNKFSETWESFKAGASPVLQPAIEAISKMGDAVSNGCASAGKACSPPLKRSWKLLWNPQEKPENHGGAIYLTYRFVKEHWKEIIGFLAAWAIIVLGVGMITGIQTPGVNFLYGFKATSIPVCIGMGVGTVLGVAIDIITVKCIDPENTHAGYNTIAGACFRWYKSLGGATSSLVGLVAFSIIFMAIPHFPPFVGVISGTIIANWLAHAIATQFLSNKGKPIPSKEALDRMDELEKQIQELRAQFPASP